MGKTKFQRKPYFTVLFLGAMSAWMIISAIYGTWHFIKHYNEIPTPVLTVTNISENTPIIKNITENHKLLKNLNNK